MCTHTCECAHLCVCMHACVVSPGPRLWARGSEGLRMGRGRAARSAVWTKGSQFSLGWGARERPTVPWEELGTAWPWRVEEGSHGQQMS